MLFLLFGRENALEGAGFEQIEMIMTDPILHKKKITKKETRKIKFKSDSLC